MNFQVPPEVQGYIDELKDQVSAMSARSAVNAGKLKAALGENAALKTELGRLQREAAAKSGTDEPA